MKGGKVASKMARGTSVECEGHGGFVVKKHIGDSGAWHLQEDRGRRA